MQSRLFDGIDERQKAQLMEGSYELSQERINNILRRLIKIN